LDDRKSLYSLFDWSTLPKVQQNGTISRERADVAQLVEQLIRNQQVVSSSLTVGSIPAFHIQIPTDFPMNKLHETQHVLLQRLHEVL
jgi:hypothetical protein